MATKQVIRRLTEHFALPLTLLLFAPFAQAAKDPVYTSCLNSQAASGYDGVSYFQGVGVSVKGKSTFKTDYKGAEKVIKAGRMS